MSQGWGDGRGKSRALQRPTSALGFSSISLESLEVLLVLPFGEVSSKIRQLGEFSETFQSGAKCG